MLFLLVFQNARGRSWCIRKWPSNLCNLLSDILLALVFQIRRNAVKRAVYNLQWLGRKVTARIGSMTFFPCLIFLPASSIETSPFSTPLTCSKCLIFCFPLLLSNNLLLPARLRTQMLCQLRDVLSLKELGRAGGEMRGKPPHSPQAVVSSE